MAQSPEYPDLLWMPPKSWTDANRTSVQLIVIHTTEGSAQASSAEDGAGYDQRRTDGTSTHYFHDNNSTVQCVRSADQAHAARTQGNKRGIQHELCTRAGTAKWADAYHQAMLACAAKQAARDAKKWGIPVRHLTVAQVAAGTKGFCGHADITKAFPQDNGTHTDPGSNFPWSQFLDLVRTELAPAPTPPKDDDMTEAEMRAVLDDYFGRGWQDADKTQVTSRIGRDALDQSIPNGATGGKSTAWAAIRDLGAQGKAILAALTALAGRDLVDEQALAAALVGLIIPALPESTEISAEQLQTAIVGALRELAKP